VKEVLLPALQKDRVDINNDTALAESVAKLSRNTPATAMLTKMMQQRVQMDRLIQQYREAAGPDSADDALAKDPFVAARGFVERLKEVATSIRGMPEAVSILNGLTGGLQRFATALKEQDGGAQALLAGAGLAGGFAAWKVTAGIWGLITAGTNLNAAAVALQAAAASLGAQGVVNDLDPKKPNKFLSTIKSAMPWLAAAGARVAGPVGAGLTTYEALNSVPHDGYASVMKNNPNFLQDMERDRRRRAEFPGGFERGMHTAGAGLGPQPGSWLPKIDVETKTNSITSETAKPGVDMSAADAALPKAGAIGSDIANALSVTATPQVNNAQFAETLRLVDAIKAGLAGIGGIGGIGGAVHAANASVKRQMNRNFTDQGVTP
jgi:hypothetical protein